MYKKITGVMVIIMLAISLIGMSLLCAGCSSQETSSQGASQPAGETQQQSNTQQPEGMQQPTNGEQPQGGPGNMGGGFNLSDEELQEKLDTAVSDGTITQEQADEILEWWQQRPEFDSEEIDESQMKEMNEWMQQQPESAMEIFGGMRGHGGEPPAGGGGPPQQP